MINNARLLDTFLDYTRIDSESLHEAAMASRIVADLTAIGCDVYIDHTQTKTGSDTGNVYATLPGTLPGQGLMFFSHMDTVSPGVGIQPVVEGGVVRSRGDTILGADDKCGIASTVEALRTIVERQLPHPTVQAIFTVGEEIGMCGAHNLEYDRLIGNRALILDGGRADQITTSAPGHYLLNAVVLGRRSHAGAAPELGISAIQALAEAITNMKLLRIDHETTANIGTIQAQFPHNIVPDRATMQAECRSRSRDKLEAQATHMVSCLQRACEKYGAQLEYSLTHSYPSYAFSQDEPFLQYLAEAIQAAGRQPIFSPGGGGTDANILNQHGICAVALGVGQTSPHTLEEHIAISDLEHIAQLVLRLMTAPDCSTHRI